MPAHEIGIGWSEMRHPYLAAGGVVALYALLVAAGELLVVEPAGLPYMMPSLGLLAALLLLMSRSLWPVIMIGAATIELIACRILSPDWAWLDRIVIVGTLLLVTLGVARFASVGLSALARRSQGGLVSTRVAQAIVGGPLLLLPLAWAWDAWRDLPYLDPLSFATSAFLGFAVVVPFVLLLRYPLIGPRKQDTVRVVQIGVCATLLVLLASLPLLPLSVDTLRLLFEFHHVLLFASVVLAFYLASRADARFAVGVLIAVAFLYGLCVNLEIGLFKAGREITTAELLSEQTYIVLLFVVGLWMSILASEARRQRAARRIREQIADDVLRTSDEIHSGLAELARERMDAAVTRVGQFARAAECRLYSLDHTDRVATLEHCWRETPTPPGAGPPAFIGFHRISWIVSELQAGNDVRSGMDAETTRSLRAAAAALGVAASDRVWLRPIALGDEVVGFVGVFEPNSRLDWRSDVGDLLTVVGDFYAELVQRERARTNILNYERDLRKLTSHVAQAEERTRRETAVSLHDGLGQTLAVARMKLREMQWRQPESGEGLDMLVGIVDSALDTTRHLINTLNPTVLYELGLVPALETLRDTVDATSPYEITLREFGERSELDESTSRIVYEAARELVSNAVRHSHGGHISIDLRWHERDQLECRICDDGVGIAELEDISGMPASQRFGLFLTRERLSGMDGELTLLARSGGGTCAIIRVDTTARDGHS